MATLLPSANNPFGWPVGDPGCQGSQISTEGAPGSTMGPPGWPAGPSAWPTGQPGCTSPSAYPTGQLGCTTGPSVCPTHQPGAGFPSLRAWMRDCWAILFSHPDDFVSYDLEMDRWLVIARRAFADRRIQPLALASPTHNAEHTSS